MKSPTTLKLTLMIGAAATLTACGDAPPDDPVRRFASVLECQQGGFPEDRCRAAYDEAFEVHAREAPKFATKDECERGVDIDRCVPTQVRRSDGSISEMFVPLMAGYIAGNLLANRSQPSSPSTGGYGGAYQSGPIYRSRNYPSGYRDSADLARSRSGGGAPTIGPGSSARPPSMPSRPPNVSTSTIARQGFGSSSFSFGGGSS